MVSKKTLIITAAVIFVVIVLPLAWYLLSPLFIDQVVSEEAPEEASVMRMASFSGTDSFHKVSGTASIIESDTGKFLRFDDFQSTNGPDLYVYVATDLEASEFINLGRLKGNIGSQNYPISENINLEEYPYVLIWCQRFSTLFGHAKL